MTPELADRIMTRIIARIEADGGVLHKSAGIEEIIGTCAVAETEPELIDVISYDETKRQWVFSNGTPIEVEAEQRPEQVEIKCVSGPGYSGWIEIRRGK